MKTPTVATGQTWKHVKGGIWRVTRVEQVRIGLSGPGPCRSYREVSLEDFFKEYTKVK